MACFVAWFLVTFTHCVMNLVPHRGLQPWSCHGSRFWWKSHNLGKCQVYELIQDDVHTYIHTYIQIQIQTLNLGAESRPQLPSDSIGLCQFSPSDLKTCGAFRIPYFWINIRYTLYTWLYDIICVHMYIYIYVYIVYTIIWYYV